jgi:hypothetical protein
VLFFYTFASNLWQQEEQQHKPVELYTALENNYQPAKVKVNEGMKEITKVVQLTQIGRLCFFLLFSIHVQNKYLVGTYPTTTVLGFQVTCSNQHAGILFSRLVLLLVSVAGLCC